MPTFARTIEFTPGDERLLALRPSHRAYVAELFARGEIRISGPWAADDGALLVYEARDLDHARELVAADPYSAHPDVVRELDLREWTIIVPARD